MLIVRPDLQSNPWIYDLIFAASSSRISTPEQFAGDPSVTFNEFCECCHSVNLAVIKTFDSTSSSNLGKSQKTIFTSALVSIQIFICWLTLETPFEYTLQFFMSIASISTIICNSDKTKVRSKFVVKLQQTSDQPPSSGSRPGDSRSRSYRCGFVHGSSSQLHHCPWENFLAQALEPAAFYHHDRDPFPVRTGCLFQHDLIR